MKLAQDALDSFFIRRQVPDRSPDWLGESDIVIGTRLFFDRHSLRKSRAALFENARNEGWIRSRGKRPARRMTPLDVENHDGEKNRQD